MAGLAAASRLCCAELNGDDFDCEDRSMTEQLRAAADSRAETTHLVLPGATNALGTIFGGTVMQWMDEIAAIAATRHCGGPVVTAAVDALQFIAPIHLGALVVMKAQVNFVAKSSMEVGVRVEVEEPSSGIRRRTTKAYFTFVAIDKSGHPSAVPGLSVHSDEEVRRNAAAVARRQARLAHRET